MTDPVPEVKEVCLEKCDDKELLPIEIVEGFLAIFSLNERRGFLTASIAEFLIHTLVPLSGRADIFFGGFQKSIHARL